MSFEDEQYFIDKPNGLPPSTPLPEQGGDVPTGLDEAVRMFKGYVRGENGFDELDFKEWLIEWREQEIAEVLDRLEAEMKRFTAEHDVPMRDETLSSIETERNKLRG